MRKTLNKYSYIIVVSLIHILLASCEKPLLDDEQETAPTAKANSVLSFNTRAGGDTDEDTKVSYPVYIYVFDTKQNCVGLQKVGSESEGVGMKLAAGNYTAYAVAVGDGDRYEMPTAETVTPETMVTLKNGQTHGDLMTAKANVAMGENETNQLNLVLERQVMMLDNVTFTDIPADVKSVSLTVSPLYENVTIGGDCTGVNGSQTVNLERTGETQTWQNTGKVYLLASTDKATLKVSLTDEEGKISSYSYVCEESLDANQKINVTGRYVSNSFALSGTIKGASWQTVKNINFDLKEKAGDNSGIAGAAPAVGTIYKNHLVVKSETQAASTVVTLMSLTETTALTYTDNDQTSAGEAVAQALDNMKSQGITLRLPTLAEWTYIRTNAADINAQLAAAGKQQITIDTGKANTNGYYFRKDDQTISLYFLNDGVTADASLKGGKPNFRLRGFATLTFVSR